MILIFIVVSLLILGTIFYFKDPTDMIGIQVILFVAIIELIATLLMSYSFSLNAFKYFKNSRYIYKIHNS